MKYNCDKCKEDCEVFTVRESEMLDFHGSDVPHDYIYYISYCCGEEVTENE